MKNVRVKVRELCAGDDFDFGIFEGKKILMVNHGGLWERKFAAIRNAKIMATKLKIPFDEKIHKMHGC